MMNNIKRNVDFLKSILRESNRHRRMEKLLHTYKDQINAVRKFTLNMLKKKIPLPHRSCPNFKNTRGATRRGQTQKLFKETVSVACRSKRKWLLAWYERCLLSLLEEMSDDEGNVTIDEVDTGIKIQFEYNDDDDSDDSPECVTWFGQCVQWILKHVLQRLLRLWRRLLW